MGSKAFAEMKRFVKGILKAHRIAANETRVGLMTFGGTTVRNLRLSDGTDKSAVEQGIFDTEQVGGNRRLGNALDYANRYMFEEKQSDGAPRVLVLVVTGSGSDEVPDSATTNALDNLMRKNVTILMVAIGKETDKELQDVLRGDKLIKVPDVGRLKEALTAVVEESGKATGELSTLLLYV